MVYETWKLDNILTHKVLKKHKTDGNINTCYTYIITVFFIYQPSKCRDISGDLVGN